MRFAYFTVLFNNFIIKNIDVHFKEQKGVEQEKEKEKDDEKEKDAKLERIEPIYEELPMKERYDTAICYFAQFFLKIQTKKVT